MDSERMENIAYNLDVPVVIVARKLLSLYDTEESYEEMLTWSDEDIYYILKPLTRGDNGKL
jgi:hypothetical protein